MLNKFHKKVYFSCYFTYLERFCLIEVPNKSASFIFFL